MKKLYIDIETIPSQEQWVSEYIADTIAPPGNIKKQESIDKWYDEKYDEALEAALEKTSFDGAMNHIVCIGCAVDDGDPVAFLAPSPNEEPRVLEEFFDMVSELSYPTVVGHNVAMFDLKIIKQRAMILGVKIPNNLPWDAKPWDQNPYDTMMQWDAKSFISLDKLSKAFGLEGKSGTVDGSLVYPLWKEGRFEELAEYCIRDVEAVRNVYKKMVSVY